MCYEIFRRVTIFSGSSGCGFCAKLTFFVADMCVIFADECKFQRWGELRGVVAVRTESAQGRLGKQTYMEAVGEEL